MPDCIVFTSKATKPPAAYSRAVLIAAIAEA